ncbi:hypothetical protein ACJIZ3_008925 [Penstemon smallii]|uniref:J domain-containing protein n=1 Tax=Penstemon smallii TaxID=265156 RepID=A0ABD3TB45_9LAMI
MECNKEEAMRAKTICEEKFEKKDFAGAKKFALKAQALYPILDGISHMLTTLDVYISAENKISGEVDWYGVLGLNPSANDEEIKKQYRKLALLLHPDKNKSPGADGAFKLISQAWSLLSDKANRLAYNQRRGFKGFQQRFPVHNPGPSKPKANEFHNFTSRATPTPPVSKTQNNNNAKVPKQAPTTTPPVKRTDTFWTICHRCKMQYEYLKMYLNCTLQCPNCKGAFVASETTRPFNYMKSPSPVPRQKQQVTNNNVPSQNANDSKKNVPAAQKPEPVKFGTAAQKPEPVKFGTDTVRSSNFQKVPLSGTTNVGSTNPFVTANQQTQDKLKRAHASSNASNVWEEFLKKRKLDNVSSQYGTASTNANAPVSRIYRQPNSTRDLTPLETRNMLMKKARTDILSKLNMWRSEIASKDSKKEINKSSPGIQEHVQDGNNTDLSSTSTKKVEDEAEKASMNVPDPDFHDFDQDRTETSFGDNEVWATYDDDDGMPRFYAYISKVISAKPFKLKISWLNSKTNTEFSNTMDWRGSGFVKTCGEFRVGRYEICTSINSFSQKVNFTKNRRGSFLIFPQKGDVWALYKNWSLDWDENTPDEVVHKYDMVTVLDDYTEEQGISVAPLIKVVGFKTVFCANSDLGVIKRIPKEEMFRFSHRVPYHLLTGQEAQNAPKGCLELDPAASPLELLQVITEVNEVPIVPNQANGTTNEA